MLSITIGTNTNRKKVIVDPNKTLNDVLVENGVNTSVGSIHIDGNAISRTDYGKTLADLGVETNAYIISVAKADNA